MVQENLETSMVPFQCSFFQTDKKGLWFYSDELAAVQWRHLCDVGRDMIHVLKFFSSDALRLSYTGFRVVIFFFS